MTWQPGYKRPKPRAKYCGVYCIRHIESGRMYIGGTVDITGRYTHHRFFLRRGRHKTKALQDLWFRDGEAAFVFETLELCKAEILTSREDFWIKSTADNLNTAQGANTGEFSGGPSEIKKQAALKRWSVTSYIPLTGWPPMEGKS